MRSCVKQFKHLTTDKLPFNSKPKQAIVKEQLDFSQSEQTAIQLCVDKLERIGAIERVHFVEDQFCSSIFTVPKSDGT